MTNALVTGATGFLGWHAALRLQRLGWNVTTTGRNEAVGRELEKQGIRFVRADLRDRERVLQACAKQDYVFHCGALSSAWGRYRDFFESNVLGTRYIVEGCMKHEGGRLIHVSTPSVYFDYRHRLGIRESEPLPARNVNAYARTKRLAEEEVNRAFEQGLQGVILRPRAIFGPRDKALLPRLLRANASRGIPLIGGGAIRIDLTYVDNVVEAMLLACEAPDTSLGRTYNISNGEPVLLRNVLDSLFNKLGVPLRVKPISYPMAYAAAALSELAYRMLPIPGEPVVTRYTVGVLARSQTLDIREAQTRLGYEPIVSVEDGLQRFAEWWEGRP
jgi:nucleoside-diphosphate-sugar epimerase